MNNGEVKVKSLQKALEVLNCFIDTHQLGVTEISERLGLYKSTVHNILSTFQAMNYVKQDLDTGKYSLGDTMYYFCGSLNTSNILTKIARPYMEEIGLKVGELVYLATYSEYDALYLDSFYPKNFKGTQNTVLGYRIKMYCCGVGKAMLAHLPQAEANKVIAQPRTALTPHTLVDEKLLRNELAEIRRLGYAIDSMEHEFGVKCVAVPIFTSNGKLEGAMSISAPSLRFDKFSLEELVEILQQAANEIRRKL